MGVSGVARLVFAPPLIRVSSIARDQTEGKGSQIAKAETGATAIRSEPSSEPQGPRPLKPDLQG